LWNIDSTNRPNHRVYGDDAFLGACRNDHLAIVQWLWNLVPTIGALTTQ
jgi:hypothetical protein